MRVSILGAGGWGTTLALILRAGGHRTTIWGHRAEHLDEIRRTGLNQPYLPGIPIPADISLNADLQSVVSDAEIVVVAVPSKAIRELGESLKRYRGVIVSVTKGIEFNTGLTMTEVVHELAPHAGLAALSGPTLALEVAKLMPSAIVAASAEIEIAQMVQQLFNRAHFRVYTSTDIRGVELGGALKNVIAIGAGIGDGLGFGDNSKAALLTRAIVEIRRLGVACGAQAETFSGLSGLGDLTVTAFSKLSRNRGFGERLGKGESIESIVASTPTVAEGYPNSRSAHQLALRHGVEAPVIAAVHAVLYEGKGVREGIRDLMMRELKAE